MRVLVAGGAGYIGSHAAKQLLEAGHEVVVVDNLYCGHEAAVPAGATFRRAELADARTLAEVFREHAIDCVMHFAALTSVAESVSQPLDYWANNTAGTIGLLRAMREAGVKRIVFSSTAAVYGEPEQMPITEDCPRRPISPYGWSKACVEQILQELSAADGEFASVALRYFNVAGSAADGSLGEDHSPETHLIPLVLLAAMGRRDKLTVFGTDYPTPDGTCIRDYIHVEDLCWAHILAMEALRGGRAACYNLGIGRGYSVRQVLDAARAVTGEEIPVVIGPRRQGDPAVLFADSRRAQAELGWSPRYTDIEPIIATAWNWFQKHPDGYAPDTTRRPAT